jgi:hypothetical protein
VTLPVDPRRISIKPNSLCSGFPKQVHTDRDSDNLSTTRGEIVNADIGPANDNMILIVLASLPTTPLVSRRYRAEVNPARLAGSSRQENLISCSSKYSETQSLNDLGCTMKTPSRNLLKLPLPAWVKTDKIVYIVRD